MMKQQLLAAVAALTLAATANANNVQVSNISLSGQDVAAHFSLVNYNITWDNGWRTSTNENNYDGAWIFVKYRKANTSEWRHATLNTTGNTEPGGATIQVTADGKGAFMYRSTNGMGTVNWTGAKIRWNYGADNVNDNDSVEIRVFATEMVLVPTGAYYLGSGGSGNNEFRKGGTGSVTPYQVTSAAAITVGNTVANLYYNSSGSGGGDQAGPIPATFPNGYNGYWIMKYEASQQQYTDFLNHLDATKATANNPGLSGVHPNLTALQPERAMGISWKMSLAYADWAGMRPATEMEYEKACRGANITPVASEYAWGNTTLSGLTSVTNSGTTNEAVLSPTSANCNYLNNYGVLVRCGIFANDTSDRNKSGAGYYGSMELTGNLYELTVSVGNANGRGFTGLHGDGSLSGDGDANVTNWPVVNGYSLRGGAVGTTFLTNQLQVSDRTSGITTVPVTQVANYGIRLARTAE